MMNNLFTIQKKIFLLMGLLFLLLSATAQQSLTKNRPFSKLDSGFMDPPVIARPKALWPWVNGNFSLSQISYELKEAKEKGMGGFDIWDVGVSVDADKVVPAGPPFLGDQSLQAIAHTIREADKLDLEIGLITSSSWNAGGAWVKPEHGAMGLFRMDTIVNGPANFNAAIPFPTIPDRYGQNQKTILFKDEKTGLPAFYREVAILAHPMNSDSSINKKEDIRILNNRMSREGLLNWDVPAGKWRIVRYVCTPTGQPLAIPSTLSTGLNLDHFSAEAQAANMNYIIGRLKTGLGSLKNRSLKYLYEDSYEVNSAVWTPSLPRDFLQKNGYAIENWLPALDGFSVVNEDQTRRFQFDFRKLLSDLIINNHYRKGREIAGKAGLGFHAEAGGPGEPIHNVPFEDLRALGSLTVPRGEFWNKHPQLELLQIVKGISSAAHIYDQRYVEAEAFTSVWLWQEGPGELKALADRAMCEGLNRFVYHTFSHTPPEAGKPGWVYNFGTQINTTNGWWELSKGFHEYIARSSFLLQQGNFVGDVAFYYGDKAPNFVPPKHIPSSLGEGYDYDVVNSEVILNKMTVKNGKIYLPHGQFYEVLVLPGETAINPQVLAKLEKMVLAGATVIGTRPNRAYGLKDQAAEKNIQTLASRLWTDVDGQTKKERRYGLGKIIQGKTIREVLTEKGINPDFEFRRIKDDSLDYIHRRTAGEDIYFIRNKTKRSYTGTAGFRVKGKQPEIWFPDNGEQYPLKEFRMNKNATEVLLSLPPEGSCFIVFRRPVSSSPAPGVVANEGSEYVYHSAGLSPLSNEFLEISNPWTRRFSFQSGLPVSDTVSTLQSWHESSDDHIRHFSGMVSYQTTFEKPVNHSAGQLYWLELNRVREVAEVYLNGERLGYHWHPSHRFNITDKIKPGKNYLVVNVVNTINNFLIGESKKPADYRESRSNITRLPNAWSKPFAEAPLLESGLLGPVRVRWIAETQ